SPRATCKMRLGPLRMVRGPRVCSVLVAERRQAQPRAMFGRLHPGTRWRRQAAGITLALRGCAVRWSLIPGALSILKGAVPDRARGLGHMAPTYFRREPGIDAPTAIAALHFIYHQQAFGVIA